MPLFLISLLGGAKGLLTSALAFLGKLNGWQLLCIALALFGAVQTVRVRMEQRHGTKLEAQLSKCTAHGKMLQGQLDGISSKRDDQKAETQTRIVTVTKRIHDAEGPARKVETAPLPGGCKSPSEFLSADL